VAFEELSVGQSAELSRTVTEADLVLFAGVTGDFNPLHVDETAAARSRFGGRVAHGLLSAGLVSAVLGTRLPGPGCIYISQTLRFTAPVRPGDTVTARVEITELLPDRRRVRLRTTCRRQDGEQVLEGEAEVWVPEGLS
jgi:3-hydroxybutyryl-CoA dehydratase